MNILEVQDIHTYYGDSYVLQGVSLTLPEKSVVGVLGRNGAGKTTLIRSICGFTPPRRGKVLFKGHDIARMPAHRIARMGVGLIPQGRRIFPSLMVKEVLQVAQRDRNGGWNLQKVLSLFPRLGERLANRSGKLSGGEQQMLATGRALLGNPDLILMDEPTEGLAPLMVRDLKGIISQLKDEGHSIVLVEQNLSFALELIDYAYIMSKGKIVYEGAAADLAGNAAVKARYLGI